MVEGLGLRVQAFLGVGWGWGVWGFAVFVGQVLGLGSG